MSFQSANDPFITYLLICKKFSAFRIAVMVNRAGVMSNAKQTLNYRMLFVLHRVLAHPICSLLFLSLYLSRNLCLSLCRHSTTREQMKDIVSASVCHHLWAYAALVLCILIKFVNDRNKWSFKPFFHVCLLPKSVTTVLLARARADGEHGYNFGRIAFVMVVHLSTRVERNFWHRCSLPFYFIEKNFIVSGTQLKMALALLFIH